MKKRPTGVDRMETGIRNLDVLLAGGLPRGSVTVIAGPPGSGKTIMTQQICFHNASAENPALYFSTLSEPTAKTLKYLNQFSFFDPGRLDGQGVHFVDLGILLRSNGLEASAKLVMDQVKEIKPAVVVIDSFRAFDDLAKSKEDLRKFGYELAVNLMAWETTGFLLGEYTVNDIETNPIFSIVDGLILTKQREQSGEQQRFLQIQKMRGTPHSRDEYSFTIGSAGVEVFAPRVTIHREDRPTTESRLQTGISRLDELLGNGIPRGSSLLVAGVAGTGKTILLLEFLYRGALAGEQGILFSFEETGERLRAAAAGMGWDLEAELARGMVEIVFIPQPDIMVEGHLLMMRERIEALGAKRVAIDSASVFLHKIKDAQLAREKVFQLVSVVQNAQAVGLFATDVPYGSQQISRFGVEETVVDGVILLSSTQEGLKRERYIEIYKLRNTAHLQGRHSLTIGPGGITVYPRYDDTTPALEDTPELGVARVATGVPGLDDLLGGGVLQLSVTLLSGSAGIGKSTAALQFLLEGAKRGEPGLYLTLEEGPHQMARVAETLGLPLEEATRSGQTEIVHLSREGVRPSQLLSLLTGKIRTHKTRRLVLDSVNHLSAEGATEAELRQLLYTLVSRFKALGVTTLLTLESSEMYSSDVLTDRRFSPIADNLIALRYARQAGELRPTLMVVKTRGSAHDFGTHDVIIGDGGVRIAGRQR
jgi:circadian clock protein KaiC